MAFETNLPNKLIQYAELSAEERTEVILGKYGFSLLEGDYINGIYQLIKSSWYFSRLLSQMVAKEVIDEWYVFMGIWLYDRDSFVRIYGDIQLGYNEEERLVESLLYNDLIIGGWAKFDSNLVSGWSEENEMLKDLTFQQHYDDICNFDDNYDDFIIEDFKKCANSHVEDVNWNENENYEDDEYFDDNIQNKMMENDLIEEKDQLLVNDQNNELINHMEIHYYGDIKIGKSINNDINIGIEDKGDQDAVIMNDDQNGYSDNNNDNNYNDWNSDDIDKDDKYSDKEDNMDSENEMDSSEDSMDDEDSLDDEFDDGESDDEPGDEDGFDDNNNNMDSNDEDEYDEFDGDYYGDNDEYDDDDNDTYDGDGYSEGDDMNSDQSDHMDDDIMKLEMDLSWYKGSVNRFKNIYLLDDWLFSKYNSCKEEKFDEMGIVCGTEAPRIIIIGALYDTRVTEFGATDVQLCKDGRIDNSERDSLLMEGLNVPVIINGIKISEDGLCILGFGVHGIENNMNLENIYDSGLYVVY